MQHLIWVYTVCIGLSVPILMVIVNIPNFLDVELQFQSTFLSIFFSYFFLENRIWHFMQWCLKLHVFSRKSKKNIISLSSAEFDRSIVSIKIWTVQWYIKNANILTMLPVLISLHLHCWHSSAHQWAIIAVLYMINIVKFQILYSILLGPKFCCWPWSCSFRSSLIWDSTVWI